MDLDLGQSLQTSGGNITGTIDPTFDVRTVARTDNGAHIDEFIGSVTTPPSSATATSFVITGPHGEPFTINLSSSTEWDGGASESQLISDGSNAIVVVVRPVRSSRPDAGCGRSGHCSPIRASTQAAS